MLTERQLFILQAIIDDYIRSAQPVGSRTISKRSDVNFSSATIRNEMADLEELGFLEKPHSSAGRIPSEKGYRFYVDHLLSPNILTPKDIENMKALFKEKMVEFERVIEQSAKILSNLTNYTTIVLGPEVYETNLKQMQMVPLSNNRAVAIFVTNTGYVENHVVTIPDGVDLSEIEKFVAILNERLKDVPMIQLRNKLNKEVTNVLKSHIHHYERLLFMFDQALQEQTPEKVYYGGKVNILTQPEFHDLEKVRSLLNILEHQDFIQYIAKQQRNRIQVTIGQENGIEEMQNCSLITATYSIRNQPVGSIAIVGPTRMEYSRAISLVDILSKDLTKMLTALYRDG